jgi:hypothetical protein
VGGTGVFVGVAGTGVLVAVGATVGGAGVLVGGTTVAGTLGVAVTTMQALLTIICPSPIVTVQPCCARAAAGTNSAANRMTVTTSQR